MSSYLLLIIAALAAGYGSEAGPGRSRLVWARIDYPPRPDRAVLPTIIARYPATSGRTAAIAALCTLPASAHPPRRHIAILARDSKCRVPPVSSS